MFVQRNRIIQNGKNFGIVIVIMSQHLIDISLHSFHFFAIIRYIVPDDGKRLCKIRLFILSG